MSIAAGAALLLSASVIGLGPVLLGRHMQLSQWALKSLQISGSALESIQVFPYFSPVEAPQVHFLNHGDHPLRSALFFAVAVLSLVGIHRRIPLGRNFMVFLMVLVGAAGGVLVFNPSFYFDSDMFHRIWLGEEILVWILLPWVSSFLFILTLPSVAAGMAWMVAIEIYAILWSSLRLVFCLGLMHFTGILFLPLLWFTLGILFDLVYLLVFYSLAVRLSIKWNSGERSG